MNLQGLKSGGDGYAPGNGAPPPPEDAGAMSEGEDCIAVKSLAMPDAENGDQMANPEVGDRVNYQVEGTVTRIEGDNAYVKRESVNGDPVDDSDDDAQPADQDNEEREQLGGMAEQMGAVS